MQIVGKLSPATYKMLDELLFDYPMIDRKIAVRKLEIEDIPNEDANIGGGKSNRISKPVEMTIERWGSDKRLNSLYAQKEAIEDTLDTLDDELTRIFWLRWSKGSEKTWEEIACEIPCDKSTIYRKRERILEIMADNYGIG